MLSKDVLRAGIVFQEFISQGFLLRMHTGHLVLLIVVIEDNQLHT